MRNDWSSENIVGNAIMLAGIYPCRVTPAEHRQFIRCFHAIDDKDFERARLEYNHLLRAGAAGVTDETLDWINGAYERMFNRIDAWYAALPRIAESRKADAAIQNGNSNEAASGG